MNRETCRFVSLLIKTPCNLYCSLVVILMFVLLCLDLGLILFFFPFLGPVYKEVGYPR